MSDPSISDIEKSVTRAIVEAEARLNRADESHAAAVNKRSEYLQALVADTLPDLSQESRTRLQQIAPDLNHQLAGAFEERKFLGVLMTTRYRRALDATRVALCSYLDRSSPPDLGLATGAASSPAMFQRVPSRIQAELNRYNEVIERARQERDELAARREDLARILDRLSFERQLGRTRIPAGMVPAIPTTSVSRATSSKTASTSSSEDSGDFDLWLYFLTDIPTSARTFLFSAISHESMNGTHSSPLQSNLDSISFGNDDVPSNNIGVPPLLNPASALSGAVANYTFDTLDAKS